MKALIISMALSLCIGCMTPQPKVETVSQWEGHYFSEEEFHQATQQVKLEKGQSIWVLSNQTLKRLLKNTGK